MLSSSYAFDAPAKATTNPTASAKLFKVTRFIFSPFQFLLSGVEH
jgi:hypothetical protein